MYRKVQLNHIMWLRVGVCSNTSMKYRRNNNATRRARMLSLLQGEEERLSRFTRLRHLFILKLDYHATNKG